MTMSIGIDYTQDMDWRSCLLESGQVVELRRFSHVNDILSYIEELCTYYPEPIIALSSSLETTLCSLSSLDDKDRNVSGELYQFLQGIRFLNSKAHHLPSVKQLGSIPRYRKRKHKEMGGASDVGSVATLLYRMRQQDAVWPEMRFLLLEVGEDNRSIVVIKDGRIVDCITDKEQGNERFDEALTEEERDQAFWEDLSQEIAGLMAIHHFEDIVLMNAQNMQGDQQHRDEVANRLGDMYQFYHFPRESSEPEGFEAAVGAALIAEGLYRPGLASEVVERLQLKGKKA